MDVDPLVRDRDGRVDSVRESADLPELMPSQICGWRGSYAGT